MNPNEKITAFGVDRDDNTVEKITATRKEWQRLMNTTNEFAGDDTKVKLEDVDKELATWTTEDVDAQCSHYFVSGDFAPSKDSTFYDIGVLKDSVNKDNLKVTSVPDKTLFSELYYPDDLENGKEYHRYYSLERPISLGTYPKEEQKPTNIVNFGIREDIGNGQKAWGYIDYSKPLTEQEIFDYDLQKEKVIQPKDKELTNLAKYADRLVNDYQLDGSRGQEARYSEKSNYNNGKYGGEIVDEDTIKITFHDKYENVEGTAKIKISDLENSNPMQKLTDDKSEYLKLRLGEEFGSMLTHPERLKLKLNGKEVNQDELNTDLGNKDYKAIQSARVDLKSIGGQMIQWTNYSAFDKVHHTIQEIGKEKHLNFDGIYHDGLGDDGHSYIKIMERKNARTLKVDMTEAKAYEKNISDEELKENLQKGITKSINHEKQKEQYQQYLSQQGLQR